MMEKIENISSNVYKGLGGLHTEKAYHTAVEIELDTHNDLSFRTKPRLPVRYKDDVVTIYKPDFKVIYGDNVAYVELKSSTNESAGEKQMKRYLESSQRVNKGFCLIFGYDQYYINKIRR